MRNLLKILIVIVIFFIVHPLLSYREGNTTTCGSRGSCSSCLNGKDSTGSICYWCKDRCVNPDDYYDYDTCSSDKQKCT